MANDTNIPDNAIKTAFDLGRMGVPTVARPDGGMAVLVPRDTQRIEFDPIDKPLPTYIDQDVTLHDEGSFCSYINRFKGADTQLFAEPGFLASGAARIVAALDYHKAGGIPAQCAHEATYRPRYSDQWSRWQNACRQPMRQTEFAEFIEECRADIREPDAARLLDIVRTFKAGKKVEFDSLTYQSDGSVKLVYDEKTEQKGSSGPLPEQMTLGIPVYFRGTLYAVPVLVRYRLGQGAVTFSLKLDRADIIEDTAFGEMAKRVADATGIAPYLGRHG